MQQIAKELKGYVNEVGFIFQIAKNEFNLKYYSSEKEVNFCGHATIAIMYDLIKNNKDLQMIDNLIIKTKRGILNVENKISTENSVFIMSPEPIELKVEVDTKEIANNLRIKKTEIQEDLPISLINAGLSTLIVPIINLDSILKIKPDLFELKDFCVKSGIDIIEVFTADTFNEQSEYRTCVFAPTFGYLEDPATGSGNAAFGYYLIQNNLWDLEAIQIEQNGLKDKFNIVRLRQKIDQRGKNKVLFGGGAITRIEGKYIIY